MGDQQQNPDGSWSPAIPLGYQPGYDAEVTWHPASRRHRYLLYRDGHFPVAMGTSRTRLGAAVRLLIAKRLDQARRLVL